MKDNISLFIRFMLLAASLLFTVALMAQTHFVPDFVGNGTDHMNIRVLTALAGGDTLEAGDEIAVYDGSICCGVGVLKEKIAFAKPGTYLMIAASRADKGLSNGFSDGDSILFKLWRAGRQKEYSFVKAEYFNPLDGHIFSEPLNFAHNGSAFVRLRATSIPVAIAGNDTLVHAGSLVYLDGSKSYDEDGDSLSYKWIAADNIQLSSDTVPNPYFLAPDVDEDSPLVFSLTVSDGLALSLSDEVIVTVLKTSDIHANTVNFESLVHYHALSNSLLINNAEGFFSSYELLSLNGYSLQKGSLSNTINQFSINHNADPMVLLVLYKDTKTTYVKMLIIK